jgi:hypothetical protein
MTRRNSVFVAIGTLALGLLMTSAPQGAELSLHTNRLTFSGPVALPGITLPGGTYIFERVVASNPDVVVVRSADRTKVYFMAPTERAFRPASLARTAAVTFGESRAGTVPPIAVWYPLGEDLGHAFVY